MTEGTLSLALVLVDAAGGGVCRLRSDGTIVEASARFLALTGASSIADRSIHALLPDLPALAELPDHVTIETPALLQVGADGVGRELSAARIAVGEHWFVVLSDRSSEAALRRSEAKLEGQLADLQADLAAREREPRRSRIRTMPELASRLDEALMRARRYKHDVTLLTVRLGAVEPGVALLGPVGESLIGCVRGVDDIGRLADDHWLLVLPHTNLEGGSVVGKRVFDRVGALGLGRVGVGCAQIGAEESGSKALERAEQACVDALEQGGGMMLAVALL
jgi:GGDEF domain-containing protein